MRKITENAVNAFFAGRNWAGGNTTVQVEDGWVRMYLHGNKIAWRSVALADQLFFSMAGWPTVTTRDRLKAVLYEFAGVNIYQRKNRQWVRDTEILPRNDYIIYPEGQIYKVGERVW